jgi:hypothetical protein
MQSNFFKEKKLFFWLKNLGNTFYLTEMGMINKLATGIKYKGDGDLDRK